MYPSAFLTLAPRLQSPCFLPLLRPPILQRTPFSRPTRQLQAHITLFLYQDFSWKLSCFRPLSDLFFPSYRWNSSSPKILATRPHPARTQATSSLPGRASARHLALPTPSPSSGSNLKPSELGAHYFPNRRHIVLTLLAYIPPSSPAPTSLMSNDTGSLLFRTLIPFSFWQN